MHGVIRRLKSRQYWDKRWKKSCEQNLKFRRKIIKVVKLDPLLIN
jgi:hypothetical protein